jgi:ferredoxin
LQLELESRGEAGVEPALAGTIELVKRGSQRGRQSFAGLEVPCPSCGAPLPIDLSTGTGRCTHCGAQRAVATPELERFKNYLENMLEKRAAIRALVEDVRERRDQGSWIVVPFLALVVLMGLALLLEFKWHVPHGKGRSSEDLYFIVLLLASIAISLVVYLPCRVAARAYRRLRPKRPVELPNLRIGRARCNGCGGCLPVFTQQTMKCPFCGADLIPDAATAHAIEASTEDVVQAEFDKVRALMSLRE